MSQRIVIASLLGGLMIFLWGAYTHMVPGLWVDAFKPIPAENALLDVMRKEVPEPGVYAFPYMAPNEADGDKIKAHKQALMNGPSGMIVYLPRGNEGMNFKVLAIEFLSDVAQALICAFLLSRVAAGVSSFVGRVVFVGLLGLLPPLAISVSYWSWYKFSQAFTVAEFIDQIVGFVLCGVVLAAIFKPRPA